MLRWMLGAGRKKLEVEPAESDEEPEPEDANDEGAMTHESWLEWIVRTTRLVENHSKNACLDDWVLAVRKKMCRWAGHTARRDDCRWSHKLLTLEPAEGHRG